MSQAPFIPYGQQPVTSTQPVRATGSIICDCCKKVIPYGDKIVDVFVGMSDVDQRTGEPVVGQAPRGGGSYQLHWRCHIKFLVEEVVDEDDEEVLEPFQEWIDERCWEIYEAEMERQEEEKDSEARLGQRIADPNS